MEFADAEGVRYIPYQQVIGTSWNYHMPFLCIKVKGEYSMVVMPLVWTLPTLMNRNLLYTAITRAKRLVVLIGEKRALAVYVRQIQGKERYTGLVERLANSTIK